MSNRTGSCGEAVSVEADVVAQLQEPVHLSICGQRDCGTESSIHGRYLAVSTRFAGAFPMSALLARVSNGDEGQRGQRRTSAVVSEVESDALPVERAVLQMQTGVRMSNTD